MKIRIHIVNKYFHPVTAGIETVLRETYRQFDPKTWDITVHTSADTLSAHNVLPRGESFKHMDIRRYRTFRGNFIPELPWNEIDVLHVNNFNVTPVIPVLLMAFFHKKILKKKFVVLLSPHGGFTPIWDEFPATQRFIKKLLHHFIGPSLINGAADLIHVVSLWEKEMLLHMGIRENLIHLIANGVEDQAFSVNISQVHTGTRKLASENSPYIIQIARIHPLKNFEVTIRAMNRLPEKLKFLIFGQIEDYAYYKQLLELVEKLGLEKRVKFVGEIRGRDKFYMLKHSKMMVHMAKYEVDSLVVKEAISQGIICIAAQNTGLQFAIRDGVNGYLIPTFDDAALAQRIEYVMDPENIPEKKRIKKLNMETRDQYRWKKIGAQLAGLIIQTLEIL